MVKSFGARSVIQLLMLPFDEVKIPMKKYCFYTLIICVFLSCRIERNIVRTSERVLLKDSIITSAHVGVSIYDLSANRYLYQKNANKYFVPASNTKLFTLYAGMKYLGDSLIGVQYVEKNDTVFVLPTGDPTFLHPDFTNQPILDFISKQEHPIAFAMRSQQPVKYGKGWSWDDANESFMPQRNQFPMFGNVLQLECQKMPSGEIKTTHAEPNLQDMIINCTIDSNASKSKIFSIQNENIYNVVFCKKDSGIKKIIPFETNGSETTISFLKKKFNLFSIPENALKKVDSFKQIKTQVSDSMFKYMMYNSDNFFAEQTLLMCCNEVIGSMNEEEIIALLLSKECKDIPQKPRWVDGSGLSRYNLFTPNDFIYILKKIDNEFGESRMKSILPTSGKGTLKNYSLADSGYIYAKTGSMSNIYSISGILLTKKNKKLLFSILINNYNGISADVKKTIGSYLTKIRLQN